MGFISSSGMWIDDVGAALARPGQSLIKHISGVVDYVKKLGSLWMLDDITVRLAIVSAVLHDFGKLQIGFQNAMKSLNAEDNVFPPPHAPISSCLSLLMFSVLAKRLNIADKTELFTTSYIYTIALFLSVYGHHGMPKDILRYDPKRGASFWQLLEDPDFYKDVRKGGCALIDLHIVVEYLSYFSDVDVWVSELLQIMVLLQRKVDKVKNIVKIWRSVIDQTKKAFRSSYVSRTGDVYLRISFLTMDLLSLLKTADRYDAYSSYQKSCIIFPEEITLEKEKVFHMDKFIENYLQGR